MNREARFEATFEAHSRRVLAYALRRVRNEADAEDAVAETFAVAWRRLDKLPDGDPLPWLLAVARRVIANQRRATDRRTRLFDRLRRQPTPTPGPFRADSAALVALERLAPDDQELLRLLAWDELTHQQAGAVLGISPNAVAIRLHRARKRFSVELGKGSGDSRTSMTVEDQIRGRRSHEEPAHE
jgi:RNA polymerase sigma-70 factor (ECF subfamily)